MEELIDILDSSGKPLGFSRLRNEVHQKGLWHRTVHIWAFDISGKILFQKRSLQKENNPGLLDTSCAGHISAGDSSRSAACRELLEELSVKKSESDLEYLFEASHASSLNNGTYLDNEFYDTYKVLLSPSEVQNLFPQKGEVDDFFWFSPEGFFSEFEKNPERFVEHPKDFEWLKSLKR